MTDGIGKNPNRFGVRHEIRILQRKWMIGSASTDQTNGQQSCSLLKKPEHNDGIIGIPRIVQQRNCSPWERYLVSHLCKEQLPTDSHPRILLRNPQFFLKNEVNLMYNHIRRERRERGGGEGRAEARERMSGTSSNVLKEKPGDVRQRAERREWRRDKERPSSQSSRLVGILTRYRVPAAFFLVLFLFAKDLLSGTRPLDLDAFVTGKFPWTGSVAVLVILSGILFRAWAAGTIEKSRKVCRKGPYAVVRHPLYLGSLLIALGFCAALNSVENIFAVLLFVVVFYVPKVRQEEKELLEKFGEDYARYMAEVPALFPYRIPRRIAGEWSWRRYWRHREWRLAVTSITALILLELLSERVISFSMFP